MKQNDITDIIEKIIIKSTLYMRHYDGKVVEVKNPDLTTQEGAVKVVIYTLGWYPDEKGCWVYPRFTNSLYTPKAGDILDIGFMEGNPNRPVYYGKTNEYNINLPKSYDGKTTTQVIFEDTKNQIRDVFDESNNERNIGKTNFRYAARKEDATLSNSTTDSTYWTWIIGFVNVFLTWIPVPNDGGAALKAAMIAYIGANPVPSSMTGKINEGSDQIKIGKK